MTTQTRIGSLLLTLAGIATALAALGGVPDSWDAYLAGAAIVLTGLAGWLLPQPGAAAKLEAAEQLADKRFLELQILELEKSRRRADQ